VRVLDAACGTGTQALPLAAQGFHVIARDVSPSALGRLRREAAARGLTLDVVVAFDNSVPHLLSDPEIELAFRQFRTALRPGGVCLCSVRDYDTVERGVPLALTYGERRRGSDVFRPRQEWTWDGTTHYRVTFIIDKDGDAGPMTVLRVATRYYAVGIARLLDLMARAGFVDCRRLDAGFYQPILIGRAR
jgi:SAM-dependent methyltransferase